MDDVSNSGNLMLRCDTIAVPFHALVAAKSGSNRAEKDEGPQNSDADGSIHINLAITSSAKTRAARQIRCFYSVLPTASASTLSSPTSVSNWSRYSVCAASETALSATG